jgi:hypothetical protein
LNFSICSKIALVPVRKFSLLGIVNRCFKIVHAASDLVALTYIRLL